MSEARHEAASCAPPGGMRPLDWSCALVILMWLGILLGLGILFELHVPARMVDIFTSIEATPPIATEFVFRLASPLGMALTAVVAVTSVAGILAMKRAAVGFGCAFGLLLLAALIGVAAYLPIVKLQQALAEGQSDVYYQFQGTGQVRVTGVDAEIVLDVEVSATGDIRISGKISSFESFTEMLKQNESVGGVVRYHHVSSSLPSPEEIARAPKVKQAVLEALARSRAPVRYVAPGEW